MSIRGNSILAKFAGFGGQRPGFKPWFFQSLVYVFEQFTKDVLKFWRSLVWLFYYYVAVVIIF